MRTWELLFSQNGVIMQLVGHRCAYFKKRPPLLPHYCQIRASVSVSCLEVPLLRGIRFVMSVKFSSGFKYLPHSTFVQIHAGWCIWTDIRLLRRLGGFGYPQSAVLRFFWWEQFLMHLRNYSDYSNLSPLSTALSTTTTELQGNSGFSCSPETYYF